VHLVDLRDIVVLPEVDRDLPDHARGGAPPGLARPRAGRA
jgi:hypothetical protein